MLNVGDCVGVCPLFLVASALVSWVVGLGVSGLRCRAGTSIPLCTKQLFLIPPSLSSSLYVCAGSEFRGVGHVSDRGRKTTEKSDCQKHSALATDALARPASQQHCRPSGTHASTHACTHTHTHTQSFSFSLLHSLSLTQAGRALCEMLKEESIRDVLLEKGVLLITCRLLKSDMIAHQVRVRACVCVRGVR